MCHNFHLDIPETNLQKHFKISLPKRAHAKTAFFPKMPILTLQMTPQGYAFEDVPWIFVINESLQVFNIRSETAHEKPCFRKHFEQHRAIIPATSVIEKKKILQAKDAAVFFMAAIFKPTPAGVAILTQPASPELASIHPRMPVIIRYQAILDWLNPNTPPEKLPSLYTSFTEKNCLVG